MKTILGRAVILVDDYDRAFEFYEKNFSCKKIFDEIKPSGQRLLHVSFSNDENRGVWFLLADTDEQRRAVGNQTAGQPTLVLYTDDVEEFYYHLQGNGVQILDPLAIARSNKFFHCLDLYGNRITIVEFP